MQLISCHAGKLIRVDAPPGTEVSAAARDGFSTGLAAIDRLLPAGRLARGAIHEVLWKPGDPRPLFFAALLASAAMRRGDPAEKPGGPANRRTGDEEGAGFGVRGSVKHTRYAFADSAASGLGTQNSGLLSSRKIIWCDPCGEIYPPALWAAGIPPDRLLLLRPPADDLRELVWAVGQCLACRGVAATVAQIPARSMPAAASSAKFASRASGRARATAPLSRIEARRLQLLAQSGGVCGLLLRELDAPASGGSSGSTAHHAAATRWLVSPVPGERSVQRWKIELIGGHGGLLHSPVYLECCRDPEQANRLRAADRLAHHLPQTPPAPSVAG